MSKWRFGTPHHPGLRSAILTASAALVAVTSGKVLAGAGTEDMRLSSQIQYSKVIQGFQDPVAAYIYNVAPAGSDTLNYSVYVATPIGNSSTIPGAQAADGGASYAQQNFVYNTTNAPLGNNQLSVIATDTVSQEQITQSGSIQVLQRGVLGFYFAAGNVVPLSTQPQPPAADNPVADPYAFGATGGGETASAATPPQLDNDPPPGTPTDELDLDSITAIGDPEISITLQPFTDLPPDDPSASPSWMIDIDTTNPGTYYTDFELNYSDEQDVGGADAPGSEHGYFGVYADVTAVSPTEDDWSVWLVVPEPASFSILFVAPLILLTRRIPRRTI
jgi:hypothetical protein